MRGSCIRATETWSGRAPGLYRHSWLKVRVQTRSRVLTVCSVESPDYPCADELQKEFVEKRHGGSLCLSSLRKHQQHVGVCTAIAAVLALYIANNRSTPLTHVIAHVH